MEYVTGFKLDEDVKRVVGALENLQEELGKTMRIPPHYAVECVTGYTTEGTKYEMFNLKNRDTGHLINVFYSLDSMTYYLWGMLDGLQRKSPPVDEQREETMREILDAARRITTYARVVHEGEGRELKEVCIFCGSAEELESPNALEDERLHNEGCPWRLLREGLGKLEDTDEEGS